MWCDVGLETYLCWICWNASHPEIFYTFSFVHQFYFWDSIIMLIIFPLLFFGFFFFLLLLFDHCLGFFCCFFFYDAFQSLLSMYSPSSCYTIKKAQFHAQPAVFLRVRLVLLPWVLIQRCIILKLYFWKTYPSFIICFLEKFFQILWTEKAIKDNFH